MFSNRVFTPFLMASFIAFSQAFVIEPGGHHELEQAKFNSPNSTQIVPIPSLRQEDEDLDEGIETESTAGGGTAGSAGLFANAINTVTGAGGGTVPVLNNPSSNPLVNVQSVLGQVIAGNDVGLLLNAVGIKVPPPNVNTPFNTLVNGLLASRPSPGITQMQANDQYQKQVQQQLQYFQHLEQLGLVNRTALVALHQQVQQPQPQQQPQVQSVTEVTPVDSIDDEDETKLRKGAVAPPHQEQLKPQQKTTEIRIIIPPSVPQQQAQLASELQHYFQQSEQLAVASDNGLKRRRQPGHNGNGENHHQYSNLPYEEQEQEHHQEEEDEEEDDDYNKKSKKDNKNENP